MELLTPLELGGHTAPNRVMFGPIVTNLGDDERRFTARHTAFYERRARGGAGIIVTEEAAVHPSDWPYERSPLASVCGDGWAGIVTACRPHGALVIAGLGHSGGQGSSAYSQRELWAPSRVPEVNAREVPKWMEADDIAAVVAGFGAAAKLATEAGCDGVEINAGQHSLVRQFLSGLTNHRGDEWGQDRLRFAREVLDAARAGLGGSGILGLRLSCDELAPWAGITPEMAVDIAAALAPLVDYLVVVRGSIFSAEKTRPDFHEPTGFNIGLCQAIKAAVDVPVILQGSVVDWGQAEWAVGEGGVCNGVEMTRAQLADPDLVNKLRADLPDQIRPCTRCNQTCQVRDGRNPIITCIGEPSAGRETEDPDWYALTLRQRPVVVVGGGVAGLEAARVALLRGYAPVQVVEREQEFGGLARVAGPSAALVDWLIAECRRLGADLVNGTTSIKPATGTAMIQATGSLPGVRTFDIADGAVILDIAEVRRGVVEIPAEGVVALFDPIGGPIAVALAEELGERAVLITQDNIAGNELSRTGDLAPANSRLQQRGVQIERRSLLRVAGDGWVELEDRFSGERRRINCVALVDCGFRLPDAPLPEALIQIGDCVAPRTIHEAILEARRAALAIDHL
jgi:mycofactocin system FadH/OYE family oxidoreductase 1